MGNIGHVPKISTKTSVFFSVISWHDTRVHLFSSLCSQFRAARARRRKAKEALFDDLVIYPYSLTLVWGRWPGPVQKYWVGFFADIVSRDHLEQSEKGCQFCTPGQMAVFFCDYFAKMAKFQKNRKNRVLIIKLESMDTKYTTFVSKCYFQLNSEN